MRIRACPQGRASAGRTMLAAHRPRGEGSTDMDVQSVERRRHLVLEDATIASLPGHYRGKVRDNYDLPDGRRILIATDRLSAFDRILTAIPFKGQVLTQTARFWFDATADLCANHVLDYP